MGIAREKLLADQLICYDSPMVRCEQTDVEGHEWWTVSEWIIGYFIGDGTIEWSRIRWGWISNSPAFSAVWRLHNWKFLVKKIKPHNKESHQPYVLIPAYSGGTTMWTCIVSAKPHWVGVIFSILTAATRKELTWCKLLLMFLHFSDRFWRR